MGVKYIFSLMSHDFGDESESDNSVWMIGEINGGDHHRLGAYVMEDGAIALNDHIGWCIESDLIKMGLDPESDEADALVKAWKKYARAEGLRLIKKNKEV